MVGAPSRSDLEGTGERDASEGDIDGEGDVRASNDEKRHRLDGLVHLRVRSEPPSLSAALPFGFR